MFIWFPGTLQRVLRKVLVINDERHHEPCFPPLFLCHIIYSTPLFCRTHAHFSGVVFICAAQGCDLLRWIFKKLTAGVFRADYLSQ